MFQNCRSQIISKPKTNTTKKKLKLAESIFFPLQFVVIALTFFTITTSFKHKNFQNHTKNKQNTYQTAATH